MMTVALVIIFTLERGLNGISQFLAILAGRLHEARCKELPARRCR